MKRILKLIASLMLIAGFAVSALAPASATSNTNDPAYWEAIYPHTECFKHDGTGTNEHGGVYGSNPTYVVLNTFNQAWFGDHWEVLIVKGGSVDSGYGAGNVVYEKPVAGTKYYSPLNNGGNVADVSHWIVCKGETVTSPATTTTTAVPTTTTTTTVLPSTTTTTPATTIPPTTTTIALTTTTVPETTTTVPPTSGVDTTSSVTETTAEQTTTTVVGLIPPETAVQQSAPPPPTTAPFVPLPPEVISTVVLPATGSRTDTSGLIAGALLFVGAGAIFVSRRRRTA